jgi:hypothetical protein
MISSVTRVVLVTLVAALGVGVGTWSGARAQSPPQTASPQTTPPETAVPQTAPPPAAAGSDHGTALMLLDRVSAVLDAAVSGKSTKTGAVGTTGPDEGSIKVVVDRGALDEIRAEIAQIKLLLNAEPKSSVALRPREKNE